MYQCIVGTELNKKEVIDLSKGNAIQLEFIEAFNVFCGISFVKRYALHHSVTLNSKSPELWYYIYVHFL